MDYKAIIIRALLLFLSFGYAAAFKSSNISCPDAERAALLKFVGDFNRTAAHFSSWEGKDCCKWEGVECDDRTGHVAHLDLGWRGIAGSKFNPSLLRLKQLSYLDLSGNDFACSTIPPWIGSFKKLNYLSLSSSNFCGVVPTQLGNLSRLQTLDLSGNIELVLNNNHWLSQLTSLQYIDLSSMSIANASSWLQALNMLPSVQEIHAGCVFGNFPQSLPHVNFSSLSLLDLSYASLWDFSNKSKVNSSLPDWLFRITSLQYLYLGFSDFTDLIPSAIGNLTSLKFLELGDIFDLDVRIPSSLSNLCNLRMLDLPYSTINSQLDTFGESFSGCLKNSLQLLELSGTSLSGNIPDWIGDLNNLSILDLSGNSLSGSIPPSLGKLSKIQKLYFDHNKLNGTVSESLRNLNELTYLDLSSNSLVGVISEHHFSNLTRLDFMDLSFNSLVINVSYDWVPPFQLTYLIISGCKLGPKFPSWLQTQKSLQFLHLSSTGISDSVPNWFWNSMTNLSFVSLANNELHGVIPNLIKFSDDPDLYIDLSSNFFDGPVPTFPSNIARLDLSNNSFSGPIPYDIFQLMPNLSVLLLSMNKINGGIPMSICNSQLITRSISNCQNNIQLELLDLSNNNLSGGIPKWFCELPQLQSLHLWKNSLSGELPSSLKACKSLDILDLGGNMFTGRIPAWLGELSSLRILSLKSNKFVGQIPTELSNLSVLQILDLSNNNLLGPIPLSFGNFTSMSISPTNIAYHEHEYFSYNNETRHYASFFVDNMILDMKGREDQYGSNLLSQIMILDLSGNSLSGCIPDELTNLLGLLKFDLSNNDLTGQVPFKIGDMTQLLYLGLSRNKLSGELPSSLSNLTFLEFLSLSYNNFSGVIPTGNQMDIFTDPNIYVGNQYLCGFQINVTCGQLHRRPGSDVSANADENRKEILLICLITIAGFAVGFWTIIGVLLVNKRFRVWWFLFVDCLYDSLYVTSKVYFARLQKKMRKTNTIDG